MAKTTLTSVMILIACLGCKTEEYGLSVDALPEVVGGQPIRNLVGEKRGAPLLNIEINEIVLSNNYVTICGSLTGLPAKEVTINPVMFMYALAGTILSPVGTGNCFRLVAEDEFVISCAPDWDRVFASSRLLVGEDRPVNFSYSYKGFPSDAKMMSAKANMNIIAKLNNGDRVWYFMKRYIGVRFSDVDYRYPKDDMTMVNIKGEGCCIIKIK